MEKIRVGIVGYGNLGKGAHVAVSQASDLELVGIFTRREPSLVNPIMSASVYTTEELKEFKGKIDVLMLCGGSATDLPKQSAEFLKDFNTVDSFDTHAKIPEYKEKLEKIGKESGTLAGISIGWDPGIFSIMRCLFDSVLPNGSTYTFWGKGVSQGHSDAIRRIDGVLDAIQYTIPIEKAIERVRANERPALTTREKHLRECYVVAKEGANRELIEKEIKEMPNYFADYDTTVHFVTIEELKEEHSKLMHGGFVIRSGNTSEENSHVLELSLKLDSNPEFTGSVLTAYARAVGNLAKEGKTGCVTVYDIPLKYLYAKENLVKDLL